MYESEYFLLICGIIMGCFTGCSKGEITPSDEVRVTIYNNDFAEVEIRDERGDYVASDIIDHSEKDGWIWVLHLERGKFRYTARDGLKEKRGDFEKGAGQLELAIDMQ